MVLKNPLLEPVLIFVERQIPVFGSLLHESVARIVLVCRIDKLLWRESCTALLALVAIGTLGTAARTCAHDIAVGEELASNLVAELLLGLLHKLVLVVECAEEVGCEFMVNL